VKLCEEPSGRCLQVVREDGITRLDVWVSLQQRVSIKLRDHQVQDLIDGLIDLHPNGLDEPKETK
jgi:hypothetical protein